MSQPIYEFFSRFYSFAIKNQEELSNLSPSEFSDNFSISMESAKVIHSLSEYPVLSQPIVIAGLLTIAKTQASPNFWQNFRPSATYIFVEFAKQNFFPITHNIKIDNYRQLLQSMIGPERNYEKMYSTINNVEKYSSYFNYVSCRSRGTPERLASLTIAAELIPCGLFDWDSCQRGEELEQLMIFGIHELDPIVFNEWVALYEKFGD